MRHRRSILPVVTLLAMLAVLASCGSTGRSVDGGAPATTADSTLQSMNDDARQTLEHELEGAFARLPDLTDELTLALPEVDPDPQTELVTLDITMQSMLHVFQGPLDDSTEDGDDDLLASLNSMAGAVMSTRQGVEAAQASGDPADADSLLASAASQLEEYDVAFARYAAARGISRSTTTTTTESTVPPTVTTTTAPPVAFVQHARIKTWYSPAEADNSEWVHFKAVDADGYTVNEALGSDLMNMVDEANAMKQTPKRVQLVNTLRQMMRDSGWTELGVDGDWYEYTYGR